MQVTAEILGRSHTRIFQARQAMGETVFGEALVAQDNFSARYDLDRIAGIFSRPTHRLVGQSYVGKILIFDTAKGGVASAWMLHEMVSRSVAPIAFVFNSVNPILVQGASFANLTMLAGFDEDVTLSIPSGAMVEIDGKSGVLRIVEGNSFSGGPEQR